MASKMVQKASSKYLRLAQAHLICRVDPAGDLRVNARHISGRSTPEQIRSSMKVTTLIIVR
jgi:hypothetical protein